MSSFYYMCPHVCVLILLYMCPHTTICECAGICLDTTTYVLKYVSSYCYICVLIRLYVSAQVCQVLGTPDKNEWPDGYKLAQVSVIFLFFICSPDYSISTLAVNWTCAYLPTTLFYCATKWRSYVASNTLTYCHYYLKRLPTDTVRACYYYLKGLVLIPDKRSFRLP